MKYLNDRPLNPVSNPCEFALRGISKSFGHNKVLQDINLNLQNGKFLTIVGPSGCGKSTLLKIIAGIEYQDVGSVIIDGRTVDTFPPKQRDVAMVFQSYALYPHLNVQNNIAVPLRMRHLSSFQRLPFLGRFLPNTSKIRRQIDTRVLEAARLLQIRLYSASVPGE